MVVKEPGAKLRLAMDDCSTLFFISKLFDLRKVGLGSCRKRQGITNYWEMKIPTRVTTISLLIKWPTCYACWAGKIGLKFNLHFVGFD